MTSVWDLPGMQAPPEPAFVKLDKVGDGFSGTVVSVIKRTFDDGSEAPQISFFDDADGVQKDWTVGQTDAQRKCAELRPDTGDHITVRFTGLTNKFKHIDVQVNSRGGTRGQAPAAPPAAAPSAPVANLPTHQQPAPVGQSYAPAAPPVYATNGGNGVTAPSVPAPPTPPTIGPPPAGIDPMLWARMAPEQRALFPTSVEPAF